MLGIYSLDSCTEIYYNNYMCANDFVTFQDKDKSNLTPVLILPAQPKAR